MREKNAVPTILFVTTLLGAVALVIMLDGSFTYSGNVALATKEKYSQRTFTQSDSCIIPQSTNDIIQFLDERKNKPFTIDTCQWLAQDFCIVLNSGSCLKKCLTAVQNKEGVCGKQTASEITAQVVLTPAECKRLALSYDTTTTNFLTKVGAGTQSAEVANTCTAMTQTAATKIYSTENPIQAYAKNIFENGDITGYVIDETEGQKAMEYTICKDGRTRVTIEGRERCDTI